MDFASGVGQGWGAFWRGVIFRQTYKQLADVVAKSQRWFYECFPGAAFNIGDFHWEWPDGERLYFRYGSSEGDYWNYHGHEYPWIGFEELTNWNSNGFYEMMKACNRSSGPRTMPRKYRSTCNPFGVGHNWVKMHFIDPAPSGTVIREPGKLPRVAIFGHILENWHLIQNDQQYLRSILSISDPNKRKAWIEGSWDVTSGGMFDDIWRKDTHVIKPFRIPETWRVRRCFDWGSSAPFAVLWMAESNGEQATLSDGSKRYFPPGTKFIVHEWYGWSGKPNEGLRMLARDVAKGIKERESGDPAKGITPPEWGSRVQPGAADSAIYQAENGVCIGDDMAKENVRFVPADKSPGSRKNGWERVRLYLDNAANHPLEKPGLYVFDTCRHTIRTFPVLPRSEKQPDDVDTEAEDHVGDVIRYEIMTPARVATQEGMY